MEAIKAKDTSKKKDKKFIGENTGEVNKDDKGYYSLISEDSFMNKGDTIRTDPSILTKDKSYIKGGDYKAIKTGSKSYKRKK